MGRSLGVRNTYLGTGEGLDGAPRAGPREVWHRVGKRGARQHRRPALVPRGRGRGRGLHAEMACFAQEHCKRAKRDAYSCDTDLRHQYTQGGAGTRTGAGAKAGAGARVRTGAWGEEGALLKRLRTGYGLHRHDACLPVHVASVGLPGLPPLPLVPACCFPSVFFASSLLSVLKFFLCPG